MFSPDEFALLIEDLSLLPAISPATQALFEKMDDPEISLAAIATFIEEDPGLASRLLKVANSPFYPYSSKVGSVREALIRLGLSSVRGIILTTSLFDRIIGEPGVLDLWAHSLAVAMTSRKICLAAGVPMMEEVAMAGLLHDIGKIPYYMYAPEQMRQASQQLESQIPDGRWEKDVFGLNHMEVGARLVSSWRFPAIIRQPIRWHEDPFLSPEIERSAVLVVALADQIVQGYGMGHMGNLVGHGEMVRIVQELGLPERVLIERMKDFLFDRELIRQRSGSLL